MSDEPAKSGGLIYNIEDVPPTGQSVLLGVQHFLTMVGATVIIPSFLQGVMGFDDHVLGKLIGTIFFVSGIVTYLQSTYGNRLPIIQGGTFSLLGPTIAVCSMGAVAEAGWEVKMQAVQGAIIVGGFAEAIIGYSGLVGKLLKYIGPVTIAPTIALIGLALFKYGAPWAAQDWFLGGTTILLVVAFSQYIKGSRAFEMFPILMTIIVAWLLAAYGTWNGHYHAGDPGFVDTAVIANAPAVRIPYPFQWGYPTFTLAAIVGMFAGFIASVVESIGDYYACARLSGAPQPTEEVVNKGIGMEGVGSIIAGLWGTGNGTTSYSENIGAIALTRVGSRKVIQTAGLVLIVLGVFGKFSAFFASIPTPIVGGLFCTLFGMIASVGLSNLQFVDLNSARNLFVIGFALFMGLSMPTWVGGLEPHGKDGALGAVYDIGMAIGQSGMSVGAILAFFLDNTIPGTLEERGITAWRESTEAG